VDVDEVVECSRLQSRTVPAGPASGGGRETAQVLDTSWATPRARIHSKPGQRPPRPPIGLVFVSCCYSGDVAKLLVESGAAELAIAVHRDEGVLDTDAQHYMDTLYPLLIQGSTVVDAVRAAEVHKLPSSSGCTGTPVRGFELHVPIRSSTRMVIGSRAIQVSNGEDCDIPDDANLRIFDCGQATGTRSGLHSHRAKVQQVRSVQPMLFKHVTRQSSSIVSRTGMLYDVLLLLKDCTLVTVSGGPGTGKQTLLREVAKYINGRRDVFKYKDGIVSVDCGGLSSASEFAWAIWVGILRAFGSQRGYRLLR